MITYLANSSLTIDICIVYVIPLPYYSVSLFTSPLFVVAIVSAQTVLNARSILNFELYLLFFFVSYYVCDFKKWIC